MRRDVWTLLGTMSDAEFEAEIAQVRSARAQAAGARTHERMMVTACGAAYLRAVRRQEYEAEQLELTKRRLGIG